MDIFTYMLSKKGDTNIQNKIENITSFESSIVNELPATGVKGHIYFVPAENIPDESNLYDEYLYIDDIWEKIGSKIDLSGYATKEELAAIRTYRAFPQTWKNASTGTIKAFCNIVNTDPDAVEGNVYLGELRCSDFGSSGVNIVNGDAVVEIIDGTGINGKVIHISMTSANTVPHRWEYTYWNNGNSVSGWISFYTKPNNGIPKTDLASDVLDYNNLSNTPIIPTNISDLNNDMQYVNSEDVRSQISNETLSIGKRINALYNNVNQKFSLAKIPITHGEININNDSVFYMNSDFSIPMFMLPRVEICGNLIWDMCAVIKDPINKTILDIAIFSNSDIGGILNTEFTISNQVYNLSIAYSSDYPFLGGNDISFGRKLNMQYFVLLENQQIATNIPFDIDIYTLYQENIYHNMDNYSTQHSIFYAFSSLKEAVVGMINDNYPAFTLDGETGWYKISNQPLLYKHRDSLLALLNSGIISGTYFNVPSFSMALTNENINLIKNVMNQGLQHVEANGYDIVNITSDGETYLPLLKSTENGLYIQLDTIIDTEWSDIFVSGLILTYEIDPEQTIDPIIKQYIDAKISALTQ